MLTSYRAPRLLFVGHQLLEPAFTSRKSSLVQVDEVTRPVYRGETNTSAFLLQFEAIDAGHTQSPESRAGQKGLFLTRVQKAPSFQSVLVVPAAAAN
jgi:hypothetical protein